MIYSHGTWGRVLRSVGLQRAPVRNSPANDPRDIANAVEARLRYEMDCRELFDVWATGPNVTLIDVRSERAFLIERIPGAISVPLATLTPGKIVRLPGDRPIVTYGSCRQLDPLRALLAIAEAGRAARALCGGIEAWVEEGFPTEAAPRAPIWSIAV